eukprot:g23706.t1
MHQNGVPSTTSPSKKESSSGIVFDNHCGQEKNILPMSQVNIPPETKKRYDLADHDLEILAPGHWRRRPVFKKEQGNQPPFSTLSQKTQRKISR